MSDDGPKESATESYLAGYRHGPDTMLTSGHPAATLMGVLDAEQEKEAAERARAESRAAPQGNSLLGDEALIIVGVVLYHAWGTAHTALVILGAILCGVAYDILSRRGPLRRPLAVVTTGLWCYGAYLVSDYIWPGDRIWAGAVVGVTALVCVGHKYHTFRR